METHIRTFTKSRNLRKLFSLNGRLFLPSLQSPPFLRQRIFSASIHLRFHFKSPAARTFSSRAWQWGPRTESSHGDAVRTRGHELAGSSWPGRGVWSTRHWRGARLGVPRHHPRCRKLLDVNNLKGIEKRARATHDGPGSLREGCRGKEPLWIVFEVSGTIHLSSYLRVSSYKTIDGRGQRVKLTGKGLQLKECEHVIVCNLEFEGGRGHDVDGIQIKPKSQHIWIDRCSLRDYDDGLIDITRESTDITVSRCYFANHDKTMLIGADSSHIGDRCIRVTIHHCFFDGTRQRHPRLRFGKVHLYNNYTRNWGIYAVCASVEAQILSQCNIYEAGEKKTVFKYMPEKAADREEVMAGWIKSEGDLFLNGAQPSLLDGPGADCIFKAEELYQSWTREPASHSLQEVLQLCTGWQDTPRPPDC